MQFLAPAYQDLLEVARQNKDKYKNADPFPSAYFDNVFNPGSGFGRVSRYGKRN